MCAVVRCSGVPATHAARHLPAVRNGRAGMGGARCMHPTRPQVAGRSRPQLHPSRWTGAAAATCQAEGTGRVSRRCEPPLHVDMSVCQSRLAPPARSEPHREWAAAALQHCGLQGGCPGACGGAGRRLGRRSEQAGAGCCRCWRRSVMRARTRLPLVGFQPPRLLEAALSQTL